MVIYGNKIVEWYSGGCKGWNEFPVVPAEVLSLTERGGGGAVILSEKNGLQLTLKGNF